MRIVVAEDAVLFREGLCRLLSDASHEVVAEVGDADALIEAANRLRPDICIVDVRMPPGEDADGARAALALREGMPTLPILLLSQHIETRHAESMVTRGGFGYLLKDRVLRVDDFLNALERVAAGGSALDPKIVEALMTPTTQNSPIAALSPREVEVLGLVAEGHSNAAIASELFLAERTVETHMGSIFQKLSISEATGRHRRVLAVLAYLTGPTGT